MHEGFAGFCMGVFLAWFFTMWFYQIKLGTIEKLAEAATKENVALKVAVAACKGGEVYNLILTPLNIPVATVIGETDGTVTGSGDAGVPAVEDSGRGVTVEAAGIAHPPFFGGLTDEAPVSAVPQKAGVRQGGSRQEGAVSGVPGCASPDPAAGLAREGDVPERELR
jgi:hypothetical protein